MIKRGVRGFTLIELMIVVAIIGILSVVAIPLYRKFQAKALQTEAKINLSALYTAEQGFAVEHSSFSACLSNIGYAPTGARKYYVTGFKAPSAPGMNLCGPEGTASCTTYDFNNSTSICDDVAMSTFFPANARVGADNPVASTADSLPTTSVSQRAFVAGAGGNVAITPTLDQWTINDQRVLVNLQNGI